MTLVAKGLMPLYVEGIRVGAVAKYRAVANERRLQLRGYPH